MASTRRFHSQSPTAPTTRHLSTPPLRKEITDTYNHIYSLSITGLRFFTVYGPWGRPDMAYFSFTRNILQGKLITVYCGKNRADLARDFTYIDDIIKGFVASLDTATKSSDSDGRKCGPALYHIFNLGNTSPVIVPTLVRFLEKHLKVKAKINEVKMPGNGDVPFTHANNYARTELGYNPATNLEAGLKKFVKWCISYYGYDPDPPPPDKDTLLHFFFFGSNFRFSKITLDSFFKRD
ncbi:hypothetical protein ZIOFF_021100 [Zingiber officinale]|uniref:NAD-dependent epimerase/dehydratase domain-containing protein n=1 Tax=Zingiber officinale TaxID=94328 RepID=A0A8J5H3D0_ZINOF|nr:hypothetical protein ZIOFF_021100 [Zingiber officinale]